ncbi:MAG: dienelactone hydrolase family protein, partial [Chloroflexota bacterium]
MDRVELLEMVRERQLGEINRRDFLVKGASLLGSSTAAMTLLSACASTDGDVASPVVNEAADPIEPGTETMDGLTTGVVSYAYQDEQIMGYVAYQPGQEPRPIVIVVQEWWGLNEHIKDVARRYAEAGYVALAPDLYRGVVTTEPNEARKEAIALTSRDAVGEIAAGIAYLKSQEYTTDKVGITGFCMGGALVYMSAANLSEINAGAAYYGRPLNADEAAKVTAPIHTFLGTEDGISADDVGAMHQVLDDNGVPNVFQLYYGAQHAFFNDTRAAYDQTAAEDAWA